MFLIYTNPPQSMQTLFFMFTQTLHNTEHTRKTQRHKMSINQTYWLRTVSALSKLFSLNNEVWDKVHHQWCTSPVVYITSGVQYVHITSGVHYVYITSDVQYVYITSDVQYVYITSDVLYVLIISGVHYVYITSDVQYVYITSGAQYLYIKLCWISVIRQSLFMFTSNKLHFTVVYVDEFVMVFTRIAALSLLSISLIF